MLLQGIFLPLLTPFYPDGRVYLKKLEHNVARYSLTSAAGLIVLGDAAEAEGLTDDETRQVLTTTIAAAAREKVIIASIGRASVFATLLLAEFASFLNYDVLALRAPEFLSDPGLESEVLTYFRAIADQSPLPLLLVSDSARPLPHDLLVELAAHPQIIGLLSDDAPAAIERLLSATASTKRDVTVTTVFAAVTLRMLQTRSMPGGATFVSADTLAQGTPAVALPPSAPALKTRTKQVGFQILSSSTERMLSSWQAGAVGAVPKLGACAPQACCEVWQAFKDEDGSLAEEKQERVVAAARHMEGPRGIAALKHGCDVNGYYGGRPRLPLLSLAAEQRRLVESELARMRN